MCEFNVNTREFAEVMKYLNQIVPRKGFLPVIACILIEAKDEKVSILGSDGDRFVRTTLQDVDIQVEGTILVRAYELGEFLRRVSKVDRVTMRPSAKHENKMLLIAGSKTLEIGTLPPEEYVTPPGYKKSELAWKISSDKLLKFLKLQANVTPYEEFRTVTHGFAFRIQDGQQLNILSATNISMVYCETTLEPEGMFAAQHEDAVDLWVPRETIEIVARWNTDVTIIAGDNEKDKSVVIFENDFMSLYSPLLQVESNIMETGPTLFEREVLESCHIDTLDLADALETCKIIYNKQAKEVDPLELKFSNDVLHLKHSNTFEGAETNIDLVTDTVTESSGSTVHIDFLTTLALVSNVGEDEGLLTIRKDAERDRANALSLHGHIGEEFDYNAFIALRVE